MTVFEKLAVHRHRRLAVVRALVWAMGLGGAMACWAALPIQQWTQANGARVYLVESHSIPMVDVQIDFDGGSRRDPPQMAGLATATASMTALGVRASSAGPALDENALGEAWADLGAQWAPSASADRLSFSLRSLTDRALLDQAARLAARQIGEPSMPPALWQRERERLVAALREADTKPATVASRAFQSAVYGGHPYGYDMRPETLERIQIDDMRDYLARTLQPCAARISIVGDVAREQADALARTLLSRLPDGACRPQPAVPEVAPLSQAKEERIPFNSSQAHVLMGQPGYKRDDPDFFALLVGNYILGGGGFVSRLTHEVREKRGLSYSVYSYFAPARHAGAFTVGLQTRPDQVDQAVQVAREVVARYVAEGPTAPELQAAKDNLVGGFALRIDTNRKLMDNVANIAWNDLPLDYLDTWTQRIEAVTLEDVRAALQRKLQPERMVTVIVGGTK